MKKRSIAFVDDSPIVRAILQKWSSKELTNWNYDIYENYERLESNLKDDLPEYVICDMRIDHPMMMDAIDFMKKMKNNNVHLNYIILSAMDPNDLKKLIEDIPGIIACLEKPTKLDNLKKFLK